ncbi:MAG: prephenate dehydrogenase [Planctomycetota bacterium]
MLEDIQQITIVGTGLLGASVGLGLRAGGFAGQVVGVGRSPTTVERAVAAGAIDRGVQDLAEAVGTPGPTLVVVAVPVGGFAEIFRDLAPHQRRGMYVTDVGSTKLSVAADAKRYLSQPQFFVPAHPMAGSERQGPDHAEADLFRGRPCVLCPTADTDADALALVTAFWEGLGATLHTMTADAHDRQVAAVSHLPHLVAVLLAHTADDMGPLDLASTGFRDTTRLALSNPPMRRDIIEANRAPIAEALDRLAARLNELRGTIRKAKHTDLLDLLTDAQVIRQAWGDTQAAASRPLMNDKPEESPPR